MLWLIVAALLVAWAIGLLLNKDGFIHILMLCAIAIAVVKFVAARRAAQDR